MPIIRPSQYDCDKSEKGDMIAIKPRPFLYKWYRKNFQKDKIILKVRKNWDSDETIEVYQEDCTLLFSWEILSRCEFKNEVPYYVGFNNRFFRTRNKLQLIQFGCENISIVLKNGLSVLIPTADMKRGIDQVETIINKVDENRQIQQSLKFARYKGDYFKKRYKELDIKEWNITYCSVCGKPVTIKFENDEPHLDNTCDCGNMLIKSEPLTWDMVAYWYNGQISKPAVDRYKEFWKI